jgi:hypothetical protein
LAVLDLHIDDELGQHALGQLGGSTEVPLLDVAEVPAVRGRVRVQFFCGPDDTHGLERSVDAHVERWFPHRMDCRAQLWVMILHVEDDGLGEDLQPLKHKIRMSHK